MASPCVSKTKRSRRASPGSTFQESMTMRKFVPVKVAALAAALSVATTLPAFAQTAESPDILHISAGAVALADTNEDKRHWSTWSINLTDGSTAYGWTSEANITLPHSLNFELAGMGKIDAIALDTRFAPVLREDGSSSQSPDGGAVRRFALLGSTVGPDGPFETVFEGEAPNDQRTRFVLPKPVSARWFKLDVRSNWGASPQSRLSELEIQGQLEDRGTAPDDEVSGYYTHEYGPIILRKEGDRVYGCYNNGDGKLAGIGFGRVLRLAWHAPGEVSIGMATFAPAHGKLYGFWYRDGDRMGSPWNAVKEKSLAETDLGTCRASVYPESAVAAN